MTRRLWGLLSVACLLVGLPGFRFDPPHPAMGFGEAVAAQADECSASSFAGIAGAQPRAAEQLLEWCKSARDRDAQPARNAPGAAATNTLANAGTVGITCPPWSQQCYCWQGTHFNGCQNFTAHCTGNLTCGPLGHVCHCTSKAPAGNADFAKLVIRTMGVDNKACFRVGGRTYCFSRTLQKPQAITAADTSAGGAPTASPALSLCASSATGALQDCKPAKADGWDCDNYGPGPKHCHCTGEQGCLALASLPTCEGGSCGNCTKGQCCCTAK